MNQEQPIGIFDSGVGGLATLKYMQERFPEEDFIYLADEKNFPYGVKTKEELLAHVGRVITYLESQKVKLIIIACNTASTLLDELHDRFSVPLFGVIDSTVDEIRSLPDLKTILVLATGYTIMSNSYQNRLSGYEVKGLACNDFAKIAENGEFHHPFIRQHLLGLSEPDGIVLGCTHFSFLKDAIREVFPHSVIIESSKTVVNKVYTYLEKEHLLWRNHRGTTLLFTSGEVGSFVHKASVLGVRGRSYHGVLL